MYGGAEVPECPPWCLQSPPPPPFPKGWCILGVLEEHPRRTPPRPRGLGAPFQWASIPLGGMFRRSTRGGTLGGGWGRVRRKGVDFTVSSGGLDFSTPAPPTHDPGHPRASLLVSGSLNTPRNDAATTAPSPMRVGGGGSCLWWEVACFSAAAVFTRPALARPQGRIWRCGARSVGYYHQRREKEGRAGCRWLSGGAGSSWH